MQSKILDIHGQPFTFDDAQQTEMIVAWGGCNIIIVTTRQAV